MANAKDLREAFPDDDRRLEVLKNAIESAKELEGLWTKKAEMATKHRRGLEQLLAEEFPDD